MNFHEKISFLIFSIFNIFSQIVNDEKIGRLLRASRDLSAGNVLISESPVIIGPKWTLDEDEEMLKFTCVGCFESIKTLYHKCPVCSWPACSSECIGLMNTELHDIECQILKFGKGIKPLLL